jgi:predicted Zn-ribbon and HTH transcriptional regulator
MSVNRTLGRIKLDGFKCERCGHTWVPRMHDDEVSDPPVICPRCKSPYWNKPKRDKMLKK